MQNIIYFCYIWFVLGGLFEHQYHGQEIAFKYVIDEINSRRDILPFTKLTYDVKNGLSEDSFISSKKGRAVLNSL